MKLISGLLTIDIYDSLQAYRSCEERDFDTDWWTPLANTITLRSGPTPSDAYLLLLHRDIKSMSLASLTHTIHLYTGQRPSTPPSPLDPKQGNFITSGWIFRSASPLDPSSDPSDEKALYLVRFQDFRCLADYDPSSPSPLYSRDESDLLGSIAKTYNLVDRYQSLPSAESTSIPSQYRHPAGDRFLFYPESIKKKPGTAPPPTTTNPFLEDPNTHEAFTWKEVYEDLWSRLPSPLDLFDPTGFQFPPQAEIDNTESKFPKHPLNLIWRNTSAWKAVTTFLSFTGQDVYPTLNGTYTIQGGKPDPLPNPIETYFSTLSTPAHLIDVNFQGLTIFLPKYYGVLFPDHDYQWYNIEEADAQGVPAVTVSPAQFHYPKHYYEVPILTSTYLPSNPPVVYRPKILSNANPTIKQLEENTKVVVQDYTTERIYFPYYGHYKSWRQGSDNREKLEALSKEIVSRKLGDILRVDYNEYVFSGLHPIVPNPYHPQVTFNFSTLGSVRSSGPSTTISPPPLPPSAQLSHF